MRHFTCWRMGSISLDISSTANLKIRLKQAYYHVISQRQILSTGNLPQDSALVCINIDISPEMAAQSVQRNQAFCVTTSDWSPITSA